LQNFQQKYGKRVAAGYQMWQFMACVL